MLESTNAFDMPWLWYVAAYVGVWELTADLNDLERVLEERPVVGVDARLAQVALLAHVDEHAAELLLIVAHVHLQAPRQR